MERQAADGERAQASPRPLTPRPPSTRPWWRGGWGVVAAAGLLPLAAAALLALRWAPPSPPAPPAPATAELSPLPEVPSPEPPSPDTLLRVRASTAAELERLFRELDYRWPPRGPVPAVAVERLPRDLPAVRDVRRRKALFLRVVLPLVLVENRRVRAQRREVEALLAHGVPPIGSARRERLEDLARRYGVKGDLGLPRVRRRLLRRMDEIPPALALAQAAIESGWGTSRFALEGNNLFGQWTLAEHRGLVPVERPPGSRYAVRAFPDLQASVRAYLLNLNTHRAYRELRAVRQRLRAQGRPLEAEALAAGLWRYSQRGLDYVAELQAIIRANRLHLVLEGLRLKGPGARGLVRARPAAVPVAAMGG